MPERSDDWIQQARRDLDMAEHARDSGFFEWACFISQQAAEKSLKAVFQRHHAVAWGHSVRDLLEGIARGPIGHQEVPELLFHNARSLDRYYVAARYPDGFPRGAPKEYFDRKEAENAIGSARDIIQFCEGLLAGQ